MERDKEQTEEVIIEEKESSLILKMVEAKEQQQLKKVDKNCKSKHSWNMHDMEH